jgi:cold-inducible RNA-binding protein
MSKKVYVGNLGYSVASGDLEQLFAQYGTVESANVITDRSTGRSKGFGFVEMSSSAEAQAAIDALNGSSLEGRTITVNEARPRPAGGGGGGGGRRGGRW